MDKKDHFLTGGWHCRPEEYESLGYTLGLPPGFITPVHPAIDELVEKIKLRDGFIFPSMINKDTENVNEKSVFISDFPTNITTEEDIHTAIKNAMIKKKFATPDKDPINKVYFIKHKSYAKVEFKTKRDAEACVSMTRNISIHGMEISIAFQLLQTSASHIHSKPEEANYASYRDDALIIEPHNQSDLLPQPDIIIESISGLFKIEKVFRTENTNHIIIYLESRDEIENCIVNFNMKEIGGVKIIVRKCFEDKYTRCYKRNVEESCREGPTKLISILDPEIIKNASISDILNTDIPITKVIQPETEFNQHDNGKCLYLYNIIPSRLLNTSLAKEVETDVEEECKSFGAVKNVMSLPGPIFCNYGIVKVEFEEYKNAKKAQISLSGRRYDGRIVITSLENE